MADLRVVSALVAVAGCLILLKVQAVNYIMGHAIFLILWGRICTEYGQLLTEAQLTLSSVQLKFLSFSGGIGIDSNPLFGGILFHLVESGNKQLGNHSIVNVSRVVVVCKRLRIGMSFQCKLLRI